MSRLYLVVLLAALAGASAAAQPESAAITARVAAARQLAGQEYTSVFNDVCLAPAAAVAPPVATAATPATPKAPPPRSSWHVEPVRVFDNLIYLGQSEFTSWAITTSAGIIVTDPLFDYSVEDEVVGGLKKLGLDPANIKYVIVSHAHSDHAGGAKLLQERYGARVLMSQADWDYMEKLAQPWPKPRRDLVAIDGQRLTLGDTTVSLFFTPGHTPGTISMLVPVRDQGVPHLAASWGGTGMEFRTNGGPKRHWFETYARSLRHFREAVTQAGADVQIANHPNQDGATAKLAALAQRKPGAPHPFLIGTANMQRYLDMLYECTQAGVLRNP